MNILERSFKRYTSNDTKSEQNPTIGLVDFRLSTRGKEERYPVSIGFSSIFFLDISKCLSV